MKPKTKTNESDQIHSVLEEPDILVAPPKHTPRGEGLVVPIALMRSDDVRRVINVARGLAVDYLRKMPEERQRDLGISVEELDPFLREMLQLDREEREGRQEKSKKSKDKKKDNPGLSLIKGIRTSRRPMYEWGQREFNAEYVDDSFAKDGRKRRWEEYGHNLVALFEGAIPKCTDDVVKKYLRPQGDEAFMADMRKMFRLKDEVIGAEVDLEEEYYKFRCQLLSSTPEEALKELQRAQKSKSLLRRSHVPYFIDDMNYFLIELPYSRIALRFLATLSGRIDPPSMKFNMIFYHAIRGDLDGLVPALHPFGELLTRSERFLKIAYDHFADENNQDARSAFYGSLLAAATVYRDRCLDERHVDKNSKRKKKEKRFVENEHGDSDDTING
jgi:hypothetical protein